jgi:uncharacterized damage-inducible protein DinB
MATQDFAAWVAPLAARDGESRAEAIRLARSLGERELAKPTGDTGWCVRDELAHMAGSDVDFLRALGALVCGEQADTSLFADIDARNARNLEARRGRSIGEIAGELEKSGGELRSLLGRLTPSDQSRQPEGFPFAVGALIDGYTQHGQYHVAQVRAALGLPAGGATGR